MPKRRHNSSDSDDERKEKRRKQKRDYATRRRQKEKTLMETLDTANRRLFKRSRRQKQQIDMLKTWALYAKSYLSLCCQVVTFSPGPREKSRQSAPVTSLHRAAPSSTSKREARPTSQAFARNGGKAFADTGMGVKGNFHAVNAAWTLPDTTTPSDRFTNEDTARILSTVDLTGDAPDRRNFENAAKSAQNRFTTFSTADMRRKTSDSFRAADTTGFGITDLASCSPARFSDADTTISGAWRRLNAAHKTLDFLSRETSESSADVQAADLLLAVLNQANSNLGGDRDLGCTNDQFSRDTGKLCVAV